jgi:DNA-binding GntR family transcriptional regulator
MPNRLAESVAEHDSIMQAFEQKDAKLAEELVREHVKMGKIAIEKSSLDYY